MLPSNCNGRFSISRELILADLLFSILAILFFRGGLRFWNTRYQQKELWVDGRNGSSVSNVALIGANETGSQVVSELKAKRMYGLKPVAIFDDDDRYHGRDFHGVPVIGKPENLAEFYREFNIRSLIIVPDNFSSGRTREFIQLGESLNLKVFIVPSLSDFVADKVYVSRIRPIDFEDFLERKPVTLHFDNLLNQIKNKVVAVTGAGGSIGCELARQLVRAQPSKLLLIDHAEHNLFKVEQDLLRDGQTGIPLLMDITNESALRRCFERFRPQIVYHAAAYKHVPMLESQPGVALRNNTFGTRLLALLSSEFRVDRFVLVSTDKAINPINYMGASKRMAEIFSMAVQERPGNQTQFMAVRFGNVLGSAGSVLPIFKEQIARGGPVTVTHAEATRYFMTIPEAVGLILEASTFPNVGGKTFVLDMGMPVKVLDIAKKLIEWNHLQVGTDIDIIFTGLRPGEKLHEDLDYHSEMLMKTLHPSIFLFGREPCPEGALKCLAQDFPESPEQIDAFIENFVPAFRERRKILF
jgi:FlaA1/EpsC-like NDP-sugar epimerase